jgi:lactate dehydrogenase-like 2-hydroxyacid dehydrogenase
MGCRELASTGDSSRVHRLALIQLRAPATKIVDLAATERRSVATVGDTTSGTVAEHCVMLMLALCRNLRWQHDAVVNGDGCRQAVEAAERRGR